MRVVAAWDDSSMRHHIGLLALEAHGGRILRSIEVPTRTHGLACLPDGTVLAVARRPGEWLMRWHPCGGPDGRKGTARWSWAEGDRRFSGHVTAAADPRICYTTEIAGEDGRGWLVQRATATLQAQAAWPTQGADPHDMEWLGEFDLLVANGGVQSLPETGRAKRGLDHMDSSLVRIDVRSGEATGQWRLSDARLSLRHLCRQGDGQIGVALQAQHDLPQARAAAPLLALFDPQAGGLVAVPGVSCFSGYAGDIAARHGHWLLSCPQENRVQVLGPTGQHSHDQRLPAACALVGDAPGGAFWALGRDSAQRVDAAAPHRLLAHGAEFDNHAVRWTGLWPSRL